MTGYNLVNLADMLDELGEDRVKSILFDYSCPLNKDIEYFLHYKAIEFSKQGLAKTHLIYTSYKKSPVLIGYFSLSSKVIMISKNALSKTLRKRISKFGTYNNQLKRYYISAPLIAQIGKNFTNEYNKLISGDELLQIACDKVANVQSVVGGKIVYLECEDIECLKGFYSINGFVNFGQRVLDSDESDNFKGAYLIQMLKYLK